MQIKDGLPIDNILPFPGRIYLFRIQVEVKVEVKVEVEGAPGTSLTLALT